MVTHVFGRHAGEARAVGGAAVTLLLLVAERVEVVVEGQLGAGGDVAIGEQTDARVAVHRPLLSVAVRSAAVVHEARQVTLGSRVDDPAADDTGDVRTASVKHRLKCDSSPVVRKNRAGAKSAKTEISFKMFCLAQVH